MKTVIVIPARMGSTRFPRKPLAKVLGHALLYRTWSIGRAVEGVDQVVVATDSTEIRDFAESFGAKVIMSQSACENGTERVWDTINQLSDRPDVSINLQGDAVLTPPWVIQAVVDFMRENPNVQMATPATQLSLPQYEEFVASKAGGRVSGTLVVFDKHYRALYFSKGLIPHIRDRKHLVAGAPLYRHIGLYGYRSSLLAQYVQLPPTPLEKLEQLEQLRVLENGMPIHIVPVDYRGRSHWSIDNPEDVAIAENIIKRDGELVL